jgi:chaperonin GroEL
MKEKKARVEDALHATRAAAQDGIVPGGGVALLRARAAIEKLKLTDDERIGADIVWRALARPLSQIARNAGLDGGVVVEKVISGKGVNFGFNADSLAYEDLVKAGVVDPAKVVRSAIQNAAGVASLLLTTDAVVANLPEKSGAGAGGGGGFDDDF